MSYDTAIIECVEKAGDIFPQTIRGDIVFYPMNKTQRLMFGCEKNSSPALILKQDKSEIKGPPVQIDTSMHMSKNLTCDSSITWMQKNKKQGNLTTFPNKWGLFLYQLADPQQLETTERELSPSQALNMICNLPIHELKKNNNKDTEQNVPQWGCWASDMHNICPYATQDNKFVDYTRLIPIMIQAIKELDHKMNSFISK